MKNPQFEDTSLTLRMVSYFEIRTTAYEFTNWYVVDSSDNDAESQTIKQLSECKSRNENQTISVKNVENIFT